MDIHGWWDTAVPIITTVGIRIVGAGILYIIGRWLIGLAVSLVSRVLTARSFDATLQRYVVNILAAVLNIVLVVAILGYLGVETTSFAALLAGAGLAIGAAWSGMLGNFAAGAFLIVFRPTQRWLIMAARCMTNKTEVSVYETHGLLVIG